MRSSPPQINIQNILSNLNKSEQASYGNNIDLSSVMPNLKAGDSLMLEIEFGSIIKVLRSSINGKPQEFPLTLNLDKELNLQNGRQYDIKVQVEGEGKNLELKLLSINNEPLDKFVENNKAHYNAPIKEFVAAKDNGLQNAAQTAPLEKHTAILNKQQINIPTSPLKIAPSIENFAKGLFIPEEVVSKLSQELQTASANMSITSITAPNQEVPSIVNNIVDVIKTFLNKPESKPLIEVSKALIGTKMEGVVVEREGLPTIVRTPLGDVLPRVPVKLEAGSKVILDILSITKSRPAITTSDPLLNILKPLSNSQPMVYEQIISKIPQGNEKILSNLVNFIRASANKDVSLWLGKEVMEQINSSGIDGKEAINRLTDFVSNTAVRENATWRIIEIPFFNGDIISKIKVATKKTEDDEENNETNKEKRGVRFVVDTSFTQLGSFQFDGYSLEKEKRFDLIIRTEKDLSDDILSNIIMIFKTSLHNVDYVGNVKISTKESFIKVYEDDSKPGILKNGIYV